MPLGAEQLRILEGWMRQKEIVQCPACGTREGACDSEGFYLLGVRSESLRG